MKHSMLPVALALLLSLAVLHYGARAAETTVPRPVMAEFMGVNGHTIQFKPGLYSQVCRKVRDYHSFEWDMGKETDFVPRYPEARNRVNWNDVYGSWQQAGFETDVCVMFNTTPHDSWKDMPRDARAYSVAFAKAFGPSSAKRLVTSVEIGNEPGSYSDEKYRTLFESMAAGLREGDPKLKVATCNITAGKSGAYEKSVKCVEGLAHLYRLLGEYRFRRAVLSKPGEVYAYEFVHAAEPKKRILVAWSPTGSSKTAEVDLPVGGARVVRAEKMPLAEGPVPPTQVVEKDGSIRVSVDESPLYISLEE